MKRLQPVLLVMANLGPALRRAGRLRTFWRSTSLMAEKPRARRTTEDWKRLRKRTLKQARHSLDAGEFNAAIRLLTRALLEDPHHAPYLELLQHGAEQKRQRKEGRHRKTKESWAEISPEIRKACLQLDAFVAYVDQLSVLLPKAGFKLQAAGQTRAK